MAEPFVTEAEPTRCAVFVPVIFDGRGGAVSTSEGSGNFARTPEAQLEEALGLAEAIDLNVMATSITRLATVRPSTLYGGGKVDELAAVIKLEKVEVVVVDHPLTPVQQRNLERQWHAKVLDRTGIILEIFGARAQTKEGRLQVDLAALKYQKGRLVRSWTHLERQRGGAGFLGGPGETQIEADRRALQTKIERLEKQLDQVRRTRSLHRKQRKKNEIPVVSFIGYTNAGKSTLFNRITNAEVFAKDLLFATLDPTLRQIDMAHGQKAILSDTVGFISNLPTDLIAAFRATLEEVTEANIIVHVRDISHEDSRVQAEDVADVLQDLELDISDPLALEKDGKTYLEVWNKIDLLDQAMRDEIKAQIEQRGLDHVHCVSAVTGEGIETLLDAISGILRRGFLNRTLELSGKQLGLLHHIYELGTVLDRQDGDDGVVRLTVSSDRWDELGRILGL